MIKDVIDRSTNLVNFPPDKTYDPNAIIVYGAGGHGKALIDLIRALGTYPIAGIVDDNTPAGSTIMGVTVFGGSNVLEQLIEKGVHLAVNAVGGIGNIQSRIKVFDRLIRGWVYLSNHQVHPTAFVEPECHIKRRAFR